MAYSASPDVPVRCACTCDSLPSLSTDCSGTKSLLRDALDRCNELRDITQAYSALENFIAPEFDKDSAEVQASRCELRALIALLNAGAGRRIETAIQAVESARGVGRA